MITELEYVGNELGEEAQRRIAECIVAHSNAIMLSAIIGPRMATAAKTDLRTDSDSTARRQNRPVQRVSLAVQTSVSSNQHSGEPRAEICPQIQKRLSGCDPFLCQTS